MRGNLGFAITAPVLLRGRFSSAEKPRFKEPGSVLNPDAGLGMEWVIVPVPTSLPDRDVCLS